MTWRGRLLQLGRLLVALMAAYVIGAAVFHLEAPRQGIAITPVDIAGTPARFYQAEGAGPAPVLVVAHGFAGSERLMQGISLAVARAGYGVLAYDLAGHGRNPNPMSGNLTEVSGATQTLLAELRRVGEKARRLGDGRIAVLGHSMATDIVIRYAEETPDVAATVAVSMFSPAVTAEVPRNLLVVDGEWESRLIAESERVLRLRAGPEAGAGQTYGDPSAGTGRRLALAPNVGHLGVLYSPATQAETVAWLDATFGAAPAGGAWRAGGAPALEAGPAPAMRAPDQVVTNRMGPWITALLSAGIALGWPLARALPRGRKIGAGLSWRQLWPVIVVPMLVTPLLLRVVPTTFLPVIVGDYLAMHFLTFGLLTAAMLWARGVRMPYVPPGKGRRLALASLATVAFGFAALILPSDRYFTSFLPVPARWPFMAVLLAGTLSFFWAVEWATRGRGAARGGYAAMKLAFLVSLGIAVALDFERLMFLAMIVPVVVAWFIIYGMISGWVYRRTGHPFVGATANAIAFAWAIGVTFPFLAGH
ncbi:alpha/beta fold hydrolase [Phaeovulum vinaykumarii]|uniref:Serine aminopeptidase, S33 n=1 Tax=Phaeovulum vinaykumarii TaxID=407234 RepID=A0A1N7LU46_9RHOB|nr:alpha/beta fold hydrolase [Phaeovulum vinaykumarii]SIS77378.1 Serine aminopeptidase, S33 [Phaeovulum vinaykumarii]SOC07463.1 serine aminopeptidase S33 family [Phaeovulum vinaykumarii]